MDEQRTKDVSCPTSLLAKRLTQPQCLDLWTTVLIVGRHQTCTSLLHSITVMAGNVTFYEIGSIEVFQIERRTWLRNPPKGG